MRLVFPVRALYRCTNCGRKFIASPAVQAEIGERMASAADAHSKPT